jgi:uncharacterized protein
MAGGKRAWNFSAKTRTWPAAAAGVSFDLRGSATYDTRPMPEDGSKLVDVAALADATAEVELSIPLVVLERLKPLLSSPEGKATGRIGWAREGGQVIADVVAGAQLKLRCQRCLEEFVLPVNSSSRVALVADESQGAALADELETALAVDGRIRQRDLVEEELLLAVPAAPRHPEGECEARIETGAADGNAAAPGVTIVAETQENTQRPFAGLADLLGGQGLKK